MRRLVTLIANLTPDSATWRPAGPRYTFEADMAAATVELLHLVARAHGVKAKPLTVPRPWTPAPKPRRASFRSVVGGLT